MENCVNIQSRLSLWIFFAAGILFAISLIAIVRYAPPTDALTFWIIAFLALIAGSIIACLPYSSIALFLEISTIGLTWLVFKGEGYGNHIFFYLPFIAAVFISVSYPAMPLLSPIAATALTAGWFILAGGVLNMLNATQWFFFIATILMLSIFAASVVLHPKKVSRHIDVLLCSYSSNTAHYTGLFIDALTHAGATVSVHRFHHYRGFSARYGGDGFVIAFPVIGWKPPWPLLYYLILKLPWGGGKPAYVLYTAAGGPENAGMLVWFLLTLKGYRVAGRNWGIYPVNVPTVRLGPKAFWRWFDSLMPFNHDTVGVTEAGRCFVHGKLFGLPFIFWPFFLWIVGVIIDNPVIDRLYRNHAFKKRCNGCGICVSYCPAERLRMVNGHLRAKGACALCCGCVNICPTNAMQLWLLTEYGRPYQPKWPSLVVNKKT